MERQWNLFLKEEKRKLFGPWCRDNQHDACPWAVVQAYVGRPHRTIVATVAECDCACHTGPAPAAGEE